MDQFKIAASFGNLHPLCGILGNISVGRSDVKRQQRIVVTDKVVMAFDRHPIFGSLDGGDFHEISLEEGNLADVVGFDLVWVSRFENMECHKGQDKDDYTHDRRPWLECRRAGRAARFGRRGFQRRNDSAQ